jgi:uncharacterized SAM-binding protein YcdF (DUF218 family)
MEHEGAWKADVVTLFAFLSASPEIGDLPRADAIFVFGNYDGRVAEHAAEVWKAGKAPWIIVSGDGSGRSVLPDGFTTEAAYFKSILEANGIPTDRIVLEDKAMNTLENVRLGVRICEEKGLRIESLILVSRAPLLRRSQATFEKQFPKIRCTPSRPNEGCERCFTDEAYLVRMLGEFERFTEYAAKGDIAPVSVPKEVMDAVTRISLLAR